jgi:hypothetical protein
MWLDTMWHVHPPTLHVYEGDRLLQGALEQQGSVREVFKAYDGDGTISLAELTSMASTLGLPGELARELNLGPDHCTRYLEEAFRRAAGGAAELTATSFGSYWGVLPRFLRDQLVAGARAGNVWAHFLHERVQASSVSLPLGEAISVCEVEEKGKKGAGKGKQPAGAAAGSDAGGAPPRPMSAAAPASRSGLAAARALHGNPRMDSAMRARLGLPPDAAAGPPESPSRPRSPIATAGIVDSTATAGQARPAIATATAAATATATATATTWPAGVTLGSLPFSTARPPAPCAVIRLSSPRGHPFGVEVLVPPNAAKSEALRRRWIRAHTVTPAHVDCFRDGTGGQIAQ